MTSSGDRRDPPPALDAHRARQRIAADLHDRFAQSLTYISLGLDQALSRHPDDEQLEEMRDQVRATLTELRETLQDLRATVTDRRPLRRALFEFLERFGDRFGVMVSLDAPEPDRRPPRDVEQQLLRLCMDLCRYAQRHNGATRLSVSYRAGPREARLEVADDGHGRSRDELGRAANRLLETAAERVAAIGGDLQVEATSGQGGRAVAAVPAAS